MNSSLMTADCSTHLKIVIVALAAAIAVMWIGINTRLTSDRTAPLAPQFQMPGSKPSAPVPPSVGKLVLV
jgi:hypothetical protein